jgi:hypothetical protein
MAKHRPTLWRGLNDTAKRQPVKPGFLTGEYDSFHTDRVSLQDGVKLQAPASLNREMKRNAEGRSDPAL